MSSVQTSICCSALLITGVLLGSCATTSRPAALPQPAVIPHAQWDSLPPVGYAADAVRRNVPAGGQVSFGPLAITVRAILADSSVRPIRRSAVLELRARGTDQLETVAAGRAFNWSDWHIAVVAIPGPGELGGGLVALEVATLASLPDAIARSDSAGGAALRLRIPHEITHVTLHHTGSAQPLRPEQDPAAILRGLQSWGASDRNWWDVPYHFLIDLEGRIYEGRDWRYTGETNTTYDPRGHLLISVIGNYQVQPATDAQIRAIADLMAWGIARFDVPLDRIGGHYNYAETSCPGTNLRQYLEDGTFRRLVQQRLAQPSRR